MKFLCRLVGHHRSARRAKFDTIGQRWESVCRSCSEPMVRVGHHEWLLKSEASEAEQPPAA